MADYSMLLRDAVRLKCRSFDRIFVHGYVPGLQCVGHVCTFLRWRRDFKIPSSAAFGQIGDRYVREIQRFAKDRGIQVVHFKKGVSKEDVARPWLQAAAREGKPGVVLIGIAQEKANVWRSWKAKGHENAAHPHMEWGRQMAFINHFYFYIWDDEWGPTFIKTNAYAPFPVWLCLNGHEWAKRQLAKAGVRFAALDNGFRSCSDPDALQRVCERLAAHDILSFFSRWSAVLPSPLTRAERREGYHYDFAVRQVEISETLVFRSPQAGRAWFESVIRDHLDLGRPDQVALVFDRHITSRTKGDFRTRVVTDGVTPILSCYYRSSRLKQYFKEGWALRTETVICNTRDFGIGRRLCAQNWIALREVGQSANRRLLDAEEHDALPAPDVAAFELVTRPSTADGQYAPGLRFGDPRVVALLATLLSFAFLFDGFTNRQLVERVAKFDPRRPYTSRHATYDLRRLRRKGLIARVPHSHRYRLTPLGRRTAALFTKAYGRILTPGLSLLDTDLPDHIAGRHPIAVSWRRLERDLSKYCEQAMTAA